MRRIIAATILMVLLYGSAYASEIVSVQAKGLVCEFCARSLEKVFLKKPEVEAITMNLSTKEIRITFKEGKTMDDDMVTKLVADAGLGVAGIARTEE